MFLKEWTPERIQQKVSTGKAYTLLHLIAGKPLPDDEGRANQLQIGHLAHLFCMEQEGKISVFGPVLNHEHLQGVIIFNTNDREEIHQLMADDPHIKNGHLTYILFDFFSIPGQQLPG